MRDQILEATPSGVSCVAPFRFGVLIAGDMTHPGDRSLRIAQEIRHYAAHGMRVGVVHTTGQQQFHRRIAPEIQTCVRRGLATVVDPRDEPATDLLIVHAPSEIFRTARTLSDIRSTRHILVCHGRRDFDVGPITELLGGEAEPVWAPTNAWLRKAAPRGQMLADDNWTPMLDGVLALSRPRSSVAARRIGWIVTSGSVLPPAAAGAGVVVLDFDQLPGFSLDRVTMLDGLAYFPAPRAENLPDTLIRFALARGVPVALPSWLKSHYGPAAHYCEPRQALARLTGKARNVPDEKQQVARSNSPKTGRPGEVVRRPVMFVASNGVGIGHLSRLRAISRMIDPRTPVVFATQAQAVGAIERLGYLAEYMPSASYVGGSFATWDDWFRFELENLLDAYDPALVVYDGNNPSDGLIDAIRARSDCRMAWVRRGLWGDLNSPFIDNARWFDLIVEPGELQGQPDEGITARRRDEAVMVPPIRLLDEGDLVPRAEAAKALGLDPARPAVLIQLGAGYNRDIVSLIDHLVGVLKEVPQLQVCIAEWANGAQSLHYWPDVTYLRGYPLSQYFRAFDFSVAAAGYNTFHEVMNFDLPTIFIPNGHPTMDNQAGRALHAQNLHAAFELDEPDLADLPDLIKLMTDPKARDFLIANGQKLHLPNGATDTAKALTSLIEEVQ